MSENTFEREVLDRLIKIEAKLDNYEKLKEQVYDNQRCIIKLYEKQEQQQQQIDELRDHNKWLARAVAGVCITAVIGLVVVLIKAGAGL